MTSEHLERVDGVTVCHGALQQLIPDLKLDLLEVVCHGVTRPRPLRVNIHHSEDALRITFWKSRRYLIMILFKVDI